VRRRRCPGRTPGAGPFSAQPGIPLESLAFGVSAFGVPAFGVPAFRFEGDAVRPIVAAEGTGGDRAEALARWQRRLLQHEVEHGGGSPR
jgi:hypothetical protein